MATNTSDFFTFSKTAGTAKNLQKPTDGGDNNLWGGYINVDLDTIVGAVNATSDLIADANQNELVDFTATTDAVNHVGVTNAATGDGPTIEAKGDDSNVDLNVKPKGTGAILLKDGDGNELVKTSRTASAVNEVTVANAATGNGPTLSATGDDTNIDLNITPKGTGDSVFTNKIKVDDVVEKTTDHGVEIDGVTLKDGGGTFTGNVVIPDGGNIGSASDTDALSISSGGVVTASASIQTDTISEKTLENGVSIDGLKVKDYSLMYGSNIGVTISSDGYVTKPSQPMFSAYLSAQLTNLSVGSWTDVPFDSLDFACSQYDTSNYTFTTPIAGKYQFNVHLRTDNIDTGASYYQMALNIGGVRYFGPIIDPNFSADLVFFWMNWPVLFNIGASTAVKVQLFQQSGSSQTDVISSDKQSKFSGYLIG